MNKFTLYLIFGITFLLGSFIMGPDSTGAWWLLALCVVLAIVQWAIAKLAIWLWER